MTTAERELFENWVSKRYGFDPVRKGDGYRDFAMNDEWEAWHDGWQARAGAPRDWSGLYRAALADIAMADSIGEARAIVDRTFAAATGIPPGPSDEANQGAQPVAVCEGCGAASQDRCMLTAASVVCSLLTFKGDPPCDQCARAGRCRFAPVSREGLGDG